MSLQGLFLTSINSCKEYFVEQKQIKSPTAAYIKLESNIWWQNMSCLHLIRTCFSLTCTYLDATDNIQHIWTITARSKNTFCSSWQGGCFSPSLLGLPQYGLPPPAQGGLPKWNGGPCGPCQRNWCRQFEYPAPRPTPKPRVIGQAAPEETKLIITVCSVPDY